MKSTEFKDLFSKQSKEYAEFRPKYPVELFDYIASLSFDHSLVWDCGTGNGQAAEELSKYYDKVIATDPSEKQLSQAIPNSKIQYVVGSAENSPLQNSVVSMITVAQAFHWFKHDQFQKEVLRVAKNNAVLIVWSYGLSKINAEIDSAVLHFYNHTVGKYWENERKHVDDGYESIKLSFEEINTPEMNMTAQWTCEHFINYLGTWSSVQRYIKEKNQNPVDSLKENLLKVWKKDEFKTVNWPLAIKAWRVRK